MRQIGAGAYKAAYSRAPSGGFGTGGRPTIMPCHTGFSLEGVITAFHHYGMFRPAPTLGVETRDSLSPLTTGFSLESGLYLCGTQDFGLDVHAGSRAFSCHSHLGVSTEGVGGARARYEGASSMGATPFPPRHLPDPAAVIWPFARRSKRRLATQSLSSLALADGRVTREHPRVRHRCGQPKPFR